MNLDDFINKVNGLPRVEDLPVDFNHGYTDDAFNRLAGSDDFNPWQGDRPAPEEGNVITELLGASPGQSVLDVGCGYGRHTLLLAGRYGLDVTGIDISPGLIKKAREMADERGLAVRYEVCRAADLNFTDAFDHAVIGYNTFSLFPDAEAGTVLDNIRRALRPGGKLFLDLDNKPYNCRYGTEYRDWAVEPGGIKLQEAYFHKDLSVEVFRDVYGFPGRDRLEEFTIYKRLYSAPEIGALLSDHGFHPGTVYGDWDLSALTGNSPKMILAAVRKE